MTDIKIPEPELPEIIVPGRTPRDPTTPPGIPGLSLPWDLRAGHRRQSGEVIDFEELRNAAAAGFVAPQLAPAIEEIITTAPRTASGWSTITPKLTWAGLWAIVGGHLVSEILKDRGQALLDQEYSDLMREKRHTKPDSPLYTIPDVMPEIVVKGKAPSPYRLPVLPEFYPDFATPWELAPMVSPQRAAPDVSPDVTTSPVEIPQPSPMTQPTRSPSPMVSPQTSPWSSPSPSAQPFATPQPWAQPMPQPRVAPKPQTRTAPRTSTDPLTRVQPRTVPLPRALPSPLAQPVVPRARNCPPCKKTKDEEEARTECYKKLVKEGVYPSMDDEYQWTEIDCLTGREL